MAKKENNGDDHEQLLQAEAQTLVYSLSFVRSSCIRCAVELGIPDILHKNGIMTISDLVASLPNLNLSKISFLPVLMRILLHSGLVHYQKEVDGYSVTTAGSLLVENEPLSMRSYFLFSQNPVALKPFSSLSHWLQDDLLTAFDTTYGKSMWDYCAEEPEFGHIFNDAMASDSKLISHLLINSEQCKHVFEGLTSLVDVGGGTGTLAMAIANAFPRLNCIVLDLPHVIGDREGITTENVEFVAGNMFDNIPYANAVLLKYILHNWSDEDCVKLLKKCRESIPSKEKGGKVMVIDIVMEDYSSNNINEQLLQVQHLMHVVMKITYGAKERTKTEWEKLFLDAGFSEYKITANFGLRSLIEIYP